MKFGERLQSDLTPEWIKEYIQYEYMKELLEKAMKGAPIVDEDENSVLERERYFLGCDIQFFKYSEKQLDKVNDFFNIKTGEANRRFNDLNDEVQYRKSLHDPLFRDADAVSRGISTSNRNPSLDLTGAKSTKRVQRPSLIAPFARIIPDRLLKDGSGNRNHSPQLRNLNTLRLAFSELYLLLIMIQKYQELNYSGFRKILKKHDKLFKTTRGADWREEHVENAPFRKSKEILKLIDQVETIFINELESGNRAKAMKRLRVPPLEQKQPRIVTFRLGIFIGMVCMLLPLLVFTIIFMTTSRSGQDIPWRSGLQLYRSSFLIILQIILCGINAYGWASAGINHILIFNIDPRQHLCYQQLLEIGTFLCVLWMLSFTTFLYTSYLEFYPFLHPLIFLSFLVFMLINPLAVFYRPARCWLLKICGRIITSACHPILFADFWLTNQLSTLDLAFFDLEYFFCFFTSDREWWSTNLTSVATPKGPLCTGWSRVFLQAILLAIPSSFRFIQCIRRYYDSKEKFPHLANAGKYASSIILAITNSIRRGTNPSYRENPQKNPAIYVWIATALISSTYKFIWDMKMDWGLFSKDAGSNRFLRDHLVYSSKTYYYIAIVLDFIFRYLWIVNIFIQFETETAEYSDVIGFGFGLAELSRRFLWNFFRLENEHINNCGKFRAVRDISFKPIKKGLNFSAIHARLSKEPGIRNRRTATPYPTIYEETNEKSSTPQSLRSIDVVLETSDVDSISDTDETKSNSTDTTNASSSIGLI